MTTIDSINNRLIIFIKAFKYFFNQIFVVNRLTKSSKFIGFGFNRLHVVCNGLRILSDIFRMIFELLDMTTRWSNIGVAKYLLGFIKGFRMGDQKNYRRRENANLQIIIYLDITMFGM